VILLLDVDGVLLHAPPNFGEQLVAATGWKGARREFFTRLFADDEFHECMRGAADIIGVFDRLLSEFGNPCDRNLLMQWWCRELVINEELIEYVRASDFSTVHLASNQEKNRSRVVAGQLAVHGFFDQAFFSCDLGVAKPDRNYFECILGRLESSPQDVIFVDDTETNVAVAGEIGIRAIQFTSNDQLKRELEN